MGGKYGKDPLNKTFEIPGPGSYSPPHKAVEGPRFSYLLLLILLEWELSIRWQWELEEYLGQDNTTPIS